MLMSASNKTIRTKLKNNFEIRHTSLISSLEQHARNEKAQEDPTDGRTGRCLGCGCVSATGKRDHRCLASISSTRSRRNLACTEREDSAPHQLEVCLSCARMCSLRLGNTAQSAHQQCLAQSSSKSLSSLVSLTHVFS